MLHAVERQTPRHAADATSRRARSSYYLALDQGMAMAGAVNALTGDRLQKLCAPAIEQRVRPLLAMEQFSAG